MYIYNTTQLIVSSQIARADAQTHPHLFYDLRHSDVYTAGWCIYPFLINFVQIYFFIRLPSSLSHIFLSTHSFTFSISHVSFTFRVTAYEYTHARLRSITERARRSP